MAGPLSSGDVMRHSTGGRDSVIRCLVSDALNRRNCSTPSPCTPALSGSLNGVIIRRPRVGAGDAAWDRLLENANPIPRFDLEIRLELNA
jgi:hypothetical protein